MRALYLLLLLFFSYVGAANAQPVIELDSSVVNRSIANRLLYYRDGTKSLTPEQFLKSDLPLERVHAGEANLDFANARFFFRFRVKNMLAYPDFFLRTARPITNKVFLYEIENGKIVKRMVNGDSFSFKAREIRDKNPVFRLSIPPGTEKEYLLELESDGEMISLPFIFRDRESAVGIMYNTQFLSGFYYGMLILVGILFFFFYLVLRERSFLFYVLYALCLAWMQFSLDGYSYQYFFPGAPWFANHVVLFSAGLTSFFVTIYCKTYLQVPLRLPVFNRYLNIVLLVIIAAIGISLTNGVLYRLSYPLINGLSLLSIVSANVAIFLTRYRGYSVSVFFTLAYTVLILGAVIFILGNFNVIGDPTVSLNALKISSVVEVLLLSITMANKYRELQQQKEASDRELLKNLAERNELMDSINTRLEAEVRERTSEIESQKQEIESQNKNIIDSLQYALRIQKTILPASEKMKKLIPDHFCLYRPKDIVSGDFYFVESTQTTAPDSESRKLILFSVVDCTGHGVPGALMSLIAYNYLKQGLTERNVNSPGEALNHLDLGVQQSLQHNSEETLRDGMDIGFCAFDPEKRLLYFSGAHHSMYFVRSKDKPQPEVTENVRRFEDGQHILYEYRGTRRAIGDQYQGRKRFETISIPIEEGDYVILFSDGYADQFGGSRQKKLGYRRFREILLEVVSLEGKKRDEHLAAAFDSYRGREEQVDDVLVLGVRF